MTIEVTSLERVGELWYINFRGSLSEEQTLEEEMDKQGLAWHPDGWQVPTTWLVTLVSRGGVQTYNKSIRDTMLSVAKAARIDTKQNKPSPFFNSPVEKVFWEVWVDRNLPEIVPQYPVGKFFVDFMHVPTRTGVEIDGWQTHSSTDAIAKDRRRQRYIEAQGYHIVRFGGKEVTDDVRACVDEMYLIIKRNVQHG